MHAGLQTSLGILEPEHLYPGTREFIGFFLKGTYGMLMDFYGILWEFHEFCRIEWEYAGIFTGFMMLIWNKHEYTGITTW